MIKVDTNVADFNAALRAYYAASKYEWSDIVNRKALQLAFEALAETPKAEAQAIRDLESREWWPKYVAKRIRGQGFSFTRTRKGVRTKINVQGSFTTQEAREVSKRIIAARVRSAGFVKSGWLPAIRVLWARTRDKAGVAFRSRGGARQYGADKGRAAPARPSVNPFAEIVNSAHGIEKIGPAALSRALSKVTADTLQYVARKNRKVAERFLRLR